MKINALCIRPLSTQVAGRPAPTPPFKSRELRHVLWRLQSTKFTPPDAFAKGTSMSLFGPSWKPPWPPAGPAVWPRELEGLRLTSRSGFIEAMRYSVDALFIFGFSRGRRRAASQRKMRPDRNRRALSVKQLYDRYRRGHRSPPQKGHNGLARTAR